MENNSFLSAAPMPKYKCYKEVWALKIKQIEAHKTEEDKYIITPEEVGLAPFIVPTDYIYKHSPEVGGYYVVYKDGYKSFSPAKAFEDGYQLI